MGNVNPLSMKNGWKKRQVGTAPLSGPPEVRYTYTQDVPWDWAHRFPPNVTPSDRPYVPGCGAEAVDVGGGKTDNVIRCY